MTLVSLLQSVTCVYYRVHASTAAATGGRRTEAFRGARRRLPRSATRPGPCASSRAVRDSTRRSATRRLSTGSGAAPAGLSIRTVGSTQPGDRSTSARDRRAADGAASPPPWATTPASPIEAANDATGRPGWSPAMPGHASLGGRCRSATWPTRPSADLGQRRRSGRRRPGDRGRPRRGHARPALAGRRSGGSVGQRRHPGASASGRPVTRGRSIDPDAHPLPLATAAEAERVGADVRHRAARPSSSPTRVDVPLLIALRHAGDGAWRAARPRSSLGLLGRRVWRSWLRWSSRSTSTAGSDDEPAQPARRPSRSSWSP